MLGSEHLTIPLRIAAMVMPVAAYFLILGLLNSRRHPQLLTGRRDFGLLIAVLSPIVVVPALNCFGLSALSVAAACGVVGLGIWALAPRGHSWIIYNMPLAEATAIAAEALEALGLEVRPVDGGLELPGLKADVRISGFSLLNNVSIRLRGGDDQTARTFERQLGQRLTSVRVEVSPMAMALLLVATGMLVAPLTLVASHADEIVRILTDLLY